MSYDFCGWATKANLKCSDGRTIMKDAFKDNDGQTVPLVWNHKHDSQDNVLGHALLENRPEGVYAYCTFNDTDAGKTAKLLVQHGDINALSIYANQLKQNMNDVVHGNIREVSLVLAGANPGASIDDVSVAHSDDGEISEAIIFTDEKISLEHSDDSSKKEGGTVKMDGEKNNSNDGESEESLKAIIDTCTDKQKDAIYALLGLAVSGAMENGNDEEDDEEDDEKNNEGDDAKMKHNIFDSDLNNQEEVLTHSDEEAIMQLAKRNDVGSLRSAMEIYADNNSDTLQHGIDDLEQLFPDYEDVKKGEPDTITRDYSWISYVTNKIHKSPISRIRTRQFDARQDNLRAFGYKKGDKKVKAGNVKLVKRTTDPQTIYRTDALNRDDIIDMTDFDVVNYVYRQMRDNLNEEIALAALIGDGRDDGDEHKISEDHIRSIWHDDDFYTIHTDLDLATAKKELNGTNTGANFSDNYIYAEAVIESLLYAKENYKGSGSPDLFLTPHMLNVMLLARDLNGRRIYTSKADLAAALDVNSIVTIEQLENRVRTDKENKQHKLLALLVNLSDYTFGSTKGGEITRFNQFDIDFNQEKYLIETRLSGALTKPYSAIALEESVASSGSDASSSDSSVG